jgi:Thioesterase superfamily
VTDANSSGMIDDHSDLPARIDAATVVRQLAHGLVSRRVDVSVLHRIAADVEAMLTEVEGSPARSRLDEMSANPRFAAALKSGTMSDVVEDGAFVDLFHDSPVSGSANPLSIGLRIRRENNESVGTVTLAPGWEGAPGRGHGGVVAACVDETIGGLLPILGTMAFTGELTLRYRAPCPLGVPLEFRAWLVERDGRRLHIAASGTGPDGVFVESTALFITVDIARLAETHASPDEKTDHAPI